MRERRHWTAAGAGMPDAPGVAMQVRKILCAIDFSESSRAALRFAVDLASEMHAALAVVYVWQAPLWATTAPEPISGDALQANIDADEQQLEQWAAEARDAGAAD